MRKFIMLFALLLVGVSGAIADSVVYNCKVTPEFSYGETMPDNINNTNNLRRKPGYAEVAKGNIMYVKGRVFDSNCVPVVNAKVTMWQANSEGKSGGDNDDPHFTENGSIFTDNLGNYSFITVVPGKVGKSEQVVHFGVEHSDFLLFETTVFLAKPSNLQNIGLDAGLIPLLVASKTSINTYEFNITLGGINQHLHY